MRKKTTQRLLNLLVVGACLSLTTLFIMAALRQSIVYFLSPTDIYKDPPPLHKMMRIGGVVAKDKYIDYTTGKGVTFTVTDFQHQVVVHYKGVLPELFRAGQGVVVCGSFITPQLFHAQQVLAKHDETYRPPQPGEPLPSSYRQPPEPLL